MTLGHKKRILIITMILTTLLGIFGCAKAAGKTVTSFETVTLTLHTMRGSYVYEISNEAGRVEIGRYREVFSGEKTDLIPEQSASCDTQTFIDLMNLCGVIRWDGFHGKHPKNVLDGTMFNFTASVNNGQKISADGSANFPKGYHEFVRALNEMLAECKTD